MIFKNCFLYPKAALKTVNLSKFHIYTLRSFECSWMIFSQSYIELKHITYLTIEILVQFKLTEFQ